VKQQREYNLPRGNDVRKGYKKEICSKGAPLWIANKNPLQRGSSENLAIAPQSRHGGLEKKGVQESKRSYSLDGQKH